MTERLRYPKARLVELLEIAERQAHELAAERADAHERLFQSGLRAVEKQQALDAKAAELEQAVRGHFAATLKNVELKKALDERTEELAATKKLLAERDERDKDRELWVVYLERQLEALDAAFLWLESQLRRSGLPAWALAATVGAALFPLLAIARRGRAAAGKARGAGGSL